jgi:hypothetical protein
MKYRDKTHNKMVYFLRNDDDKHGMMMCAVCCACRVIPYKHNITHPGIILNLLLLFCISSNIILSRYRSFI